MTVPSSHAAARLTVVVGEEDMHHHRPLATEIVHRAHAAGLAGASVYRGCEGFGAGSRVHTSRLLSLAEDLPLSVVVVDDRERVEAFLPVVGALLATSGAGGLVTIEEVTVVRFVASDGGPDGGPDGGGASA